MLVLIKLFSHAKSIGFVKDAFYHYVKQNENSLTRLSPEQQMKRQMRNLQAATDYLVTHFIGKYEKEINFFKLNAKMPLLISNDKNSYRTWTACFPEANKYIMANKRQTLRMRLVQLMAAKRQFWLVELYYQLVFNLFTEYYTMIHFIAIILTGIACSLYMFPFSFTFLPVGNTKIYLAVCGLVLFFLNQIRNRQQVSSHFMVTVSLAAFVVSLICIVSLLYNETNDTTYAIYIIQMWVWTGGAYFVTRCMKSVHGNVTVELIAFYVVGVCAIQCFLP